MQKLSRKVTCWSILLVVFVVSFAAVFFAFSATPYGHYTIRQYFNPQIYALGRSNNSSLGGEWQEQLLAVYPAGASNVPRDTSIVIVASRPLRVFNISFNPSVAIAEDNFVESSAHSPPSSVQTVYPAGLLQPNTTYNVTATVDGTPSWFTFTTSSAPTQLTFTHPLASCDIWVALTVAILVTSIVSYYLSQKTRTQYFNHTVRT